jgi:hypothetical protein
MSEKIDIIVDSSTDVEARNQIVSASSDNNVDVEILEPDYDITINKKEYIITGDSLYIPKSYEESPQWLRDIITTITDFTLNQKLTEIGALSTTLYGLIKELEVAKNTYTQSIISSADIDERINTAITTLNSSIAESDATIVDLITTKATPTEATSLALNVLTSSINDGEISSIVSNLQNTISNATSTMSNNIDIVHSEMTGEFEANAEVIDAIETSVTNINGTLTSHAGQITSLQTQANSVDGKIATASSNITNTLNTTISNGDIAVESKFGYNSNIIIAGVPYYSGFGIATSVNSPGHGIPAGDSQFWINASKFKFTNNNKTGYATPFSIDATGSQPQITFNGKVTFGSGQSGTIDQAIAAVVETVAVGDKNINITDNLIPTTSLVADTENSGYQFVGTPTKSMSAGLESFSEAQIALDGSDEVYSSYVDEITIPYYYRFGIKGITDLNRFKIVTIINSSNIVSYNDVTVTMEAGQNLSVGSWYTVDGIINPTGGTTTADGYIRDINGVKVGSINNFVVASGTTKILLGWIANCTISRMKMCKITADTITSDFSSVNGRLVNLQSQLNNVSWSNLGGKDLFAQKLGYTTYAELENAATSGQTVVNGGYINTGLIQAGAITADKIDANAVSGKTISGGIITGTKLYGTQIEGAIIKASYIDLSSTATLTNWQQYTPANYPSAYDANFAKNNNGTLLVDSQGYVRLMGNTRIVVPLLSSTQANNAPYEFGLYPYNSYKSNNINRCITKAHH